jgi:hypothetical protein
MSELIPMFRPILIAGALFLSVAAYAQAFQAAVEPLPDRPVPPLPPLPPVPAEHVEAEIAYLKTAIAPTPA